MCRRPCGFCPRAKARHHLVARHFPEHLHHLFQHLHPFSPRPLQSHLLQLQQTKQNTDINSDFQYVMPRFYIDADLSVGQTLALPDTVVRHVQVLRLNAGDAITLFNGRGGEYSAMLDAVLKRDAHCRVEGFDDVSRETPIWMGLARHLRWRQDGVHAAKGVEMGVSAFQPIAAERSIVKLSGERADKRVARWQEIVVSACEQCGRNSIPQVLPILSLEQWLKRSPDADARLILSPVGTQRLADIAAAPARAWLMAGPEVATRARGGRGAGCRLDAAEAGAAHPAHRNRGAGGGGGDADGVGITARLNRLRLEPVHDLASMSETRRKQAKSGMYTWYMSILSSYSPSDVSRSAADREQVLIENAADRSSTCPATRA